MKRDVIAQHRNEVLALAAKYGATAVRVFGSVARGDARPDSDIDIIVRFEDGGSLRRLCGLADDLEGLFGCKVDLLTDTPWMRPRLRERVEADAVEI